MKRAVWIVLLIGITWFFAYGKSSPDGDVIESGGVKFEKKNFAETLTKAQEEKKNILVDVFSFN
jgi:hypothetical protein